MLCIRGTSHGPVSMSVCVCLPVSVTSRSSTKTAKRRISKTTPHDSPGTLVFWCQRPPRNSTWIIPYWGTKCRWVGQNRWLSTNKRLLSRKRYKIDAWFLLKSNRNRSRMRSIQWWHIADDLECPLAAETTPFSAFCTAFHSFVTGEPRDFKFGTLTYHSKSHPADEKYSLKGAWSGSGEPF